MGQKISSIEQTQRLANDQELRHSFKSYLKAPAHNYYICNLCKIIVYIHKNKYIISAINKGYSGSVQTAVNITCDEFIIKSIIE